MVGAGCVAGRFRGGSQQHPHIRFGLHIQNIARPRCSSWLSRHQIKESKPSRRTCIRDSLDDIIDLNSCAHLCIAILDSDIHFSSSLFSFRLASVIALISLSHAFDSRVVVVHADPSKLLLHIPASLDLVRNETYAPSSLCAAPPKHMQILAAPA